MRQTDSRRESVYLRRLSPPDEKVRNAIGHSHNRAATSKCGSADVLAELGVNVDISPEQVGHCIDTVGIGFLFAAKLHPARKNAGGPRREIGIRTIFNILGPLTNPAGANRQLMGVFAADLTDLLAHVLKALGTKSAMIVSGYGGLDELTTSGPNTITFPVKVYSMVRFSVTPEVNAASTIVIALTIILTTIALKLQSRMGAVSQGH